MNVDRLALLSIDPARTSGWALYHGTRLVRSGIAKSAADRLGATDEWVDLAARNSLVRAVVCEKWSPGMLSHSTMIGCGAAYGRWLERIEDTGYSEDHVLRFEPREWRQLVGIRARGREHAKAEAKKAVRFEHGLDVTDDEAEAILIGKAALLSGKIPASLPARVRRLLTVAA